MKERWPDSSRITSYCGIEFQFDLFIINMASVIASLTSPAKCNSSIPLKENIGDWYFIFFLNAVWLATCFDRLSVIQLASSTLIDAYVSIEENHN